jgi:hypothetical protein
MLIFLGATFLLYGMMPATPEPNAPLWGEGDLGFLSPCLVLVAGSSLFPNLLRLSGGDLLGDRDLVGDGDTCLLSGDRGGDICLRGGDLRGSGDSLSNGGGDRLWGDNCLLGGDILGGDIFLLGGDLLVGEKVLLGGDLLVGEKVLLGGGLLFGEIVLLGGDLLFGEIVLLGGNLLVGEKDLLGGDRLIGGEGDTLPYPSMGIAY